MDSPLSLNDSDNSTNRSLETDILSNFNRTYDLSKDVKPSKLTDMFNSSMILSGLSTSKVPTLNLNLTSLIKPRAILDSTNSDFKHYTKYSSKNCQPKNIMKENINYPENLFTKNDVEYAGKSKSRSNKAVSVGRKALTHVNRVFVENTKINSSNQLNINRSKSMSRKPLPKHSNEKPSNSKPQFIVKKPPSKEVPKQSYNCSMRSKNASCINPYRALSPMSVNVLSIINNR